MMIKIVRVTALVVIAIALLLFIGFTWMMTALFDGVFNRKKRKGENVLVEMETKKRDV